MALGDIDSAFTDLEFTESCKHKHHDHQLSELENPHAYLSAEERFARLLMMLEAQFGSDITTIERPRPALTSDEAQNGGAESKPNPKDEDIDEDEMDEEQISNAEAAELARLRSLGIPFPGVEIRIDKHVVRVWLEDLEVECSYPVLKDRVRVVVERAVETVASMWAEGKPHSTHMMNGNGHPKDQLLEKKVALAES